MFGLSRLFKRKDPTVDDVAEALLPLLQAARPSATFSYESQLAVIRSSDGGVISITNLHVDYVRASNQKRAQVLQTFAHSMSLPDLPATFDEARESLLPTLRHLPGLDQARILAGAEDSQSLMNGLRPLSQDLRVAVVYDTEHAMAQITGQTIQQWGVGEEQVHQKAIDNLRHKAPPKFVPLGPGLFGSDYGDYYDAARILLPELAYQLNLPGKPVAMTPNRICLLIASDQDQRAQLAMIEKSREILMNESRPLSAEMFRLTDGAWATWQPEDESAGKALRELQLQVLSSDYESQKQAFDSVHEQRGKDVFVASFTLVQRKSGQLMSYSVLSKGVDTWLPRSDVVMFVDQEQPRATAPKIVDWSVFEAQLAPLIEPIGCYPPRFHVRQHPSDETIANLPGATI